ncbi:MAG: hypothetical protein L0Y54_08455, partial [Sporichthyaceae bacterium]|nr:hypothetical protein [Sporichthyaceae bacterium]
GLVAAGSSRRSKRYRPGRPFVFSPVWFLAAPAHQARAGHSAPLGGSVATVTALERRSAVERVPLPRQTGGASDRW